MNKNQIFLLVFLSFLILILALGIKISNNLISKEDVKKYILEDVSHKFPDADKIEILSMNLSKNEKGENYYIIKVRVSSNLSSMCPSRTNYYYFYPEQNFVPNPPEYLVKDCKIDDPSYIAFEEEAIIASYSVPGTEEVKAYIKANKISPEVVYNDSNEWHVKWEKYLVRIARNGTLLGVEEV